jgi:hypothetical protein
LALIPESVTVAAAEQIKPFGFLLLGHVDPLAALPAGLERGDVERRTRSDDQRS